MTTYKTQKAVGAVYLGSKSVKKIYKNSKIVFNKKTLTSETKSYTTAGTFTLSLPKYLLSLNVRVVGAGGGAGSDAFYHGNKWNGSGGGSGAMAYKTYSASEITSLKGKSVTIIVGSGGAAQSGTAHDVGNGTVAHDGVNGGLSSFNGNIIANGGQGGYSGRVYAEGMRIVAATASGGSTNTNGNVNNGGTGASSVCGNYGAGGSSSGYGGTKIAGTSGCVIVEMTYLKPID